MKITLIVIGVLLLLVVITASVCIQLFRAWRNTNKKLTAAQYEITVLEKRIENEKAKQEIANDEYYKAEKDKEKLHAGTAGDKFAAANDILRKHQN
mgnify:CR=1 FL=1